MYSSSGVPPEHCHHKAVWRKSGLFAGARRVGTARFSFCHRGVSGRVPSSARGTARPEGSLLSSAGVPFLKGLSRCVFHSLWPGLVAVTLGLPAPSLAQQIQLIQVASGLSSPLFVTHAGDRLEPAVHRRARRHRSRPAAGRLDADGVPRHSHARCVSGGRAGACSASRSTRSTPATAGSSSTTRAPADGALVIAEYRASSADPNVREHGRDVVLDDPAPDATRTTTAACSRSGPTATSISASATAARGNDPPNNAQNIERRCSARSCASTSTVARFGAATRRRPTIRSSARAGPRRDLRLRHAQPVALQLRPADRRSSGSATSARARARRSTRRSSTAATTAGASTRDSLCTNNDPALLQSRRTTCFPVFDYAHSGGRCSITGGYVYRGAAGALPAGTYVYGDYCTGEIFAWNGTAQAVLLDTADEHLVVRRGRAGRALRRRSERHGEPDCAHRHVLVLHLTGARHTRRLWRDGNGCCHGGRELPLDGD